MLLICFIIILICIVYNCICKHYNGSYMSKETILDMKGVMKNIVQAEIDNYQPQIDVVHARYKFMKRDDKVGLDVYTNEIKPLKNAENQMYNFRLKILQNSDRMKDNLSLRELRSIFDESAIYMVQFMSYVYTIRNCIKNWHEQHTGISI